MATGRQSTIGALVVAWNRRDDVLECIRSLFDTGYPELVVYLVDNASADGTLEAVTAEFPQVQTIRSEENLGFASGNNLGLAWIIEDELDAAFLVNDDVVVERDCIDRLLQNGFDDPGVGVISPKVLLHSEPGIIWSAGGLIDQETGIATQRRYGQSDDHDGDAVMEIDYAVGCAMLVKTEAIRKVGYLDPRYFTYYEEADWCRRIRDVGYKILYAPQGRVRHKVTLTSNGRNQASYYFARNRLLYLHSAGASSSRIALTAAELLKSAAAHAFRGRKQQSALTIRGVRDFYSSTFGKMRN